MIPGEFKHYLVLILTQEFKLLNKISKPNLYYFQR